MSKKVFTVLLLAVFMLAQFSIASAAQVTADGTLTGPDFMPAGAGSTVTLEWTATGLPAGTYVDIYARLMGSGNTYDVLECNNVAFINGSSNGSGTFDYVFTGGGVYGNPADGEYWEFLIAFDDAASCTTLPANANVDANFSASSYVDGTALTGILAIPHEDFTAAGDVACNTFEYWALASDSFGLANPTDPYSGFGSWNAQTTGTFAPAPIGAEDELLEWQITLPATATGTWVISIDPEDAAGNTNVLGPYDFRNTAIQANEIEDCADFTDVAGHENEVYVRYLADLGLISGFADGSFGPDNTLTRAEAATLIEISNGYDATTLPTSAPAGCDFTDVAASDWFAGWVWQACADGFMNGVGGGMFDPNNLLTRGQIVTIFNNIYELGVGNLQPGSHMVVGLGLLAFFDTSPRFREAAWSDVSLGAYYAEPVVEAYSWGIVDGTSETTFSPDQAMTRGEFAKTLYRILAYYSLF
ncbi:MAG TPA: S-layer homology domain-containing protein [Anaerolineales bacterium]|nr:S-layer homology domain-containing protein [Anaerolineales bacterium]